MDASYLWSPLQQFEPRGEYTLQQQLCAQDSIFSPMGTVFAEKSGLPSIQLAGATYSYSLNEVILKAGAGLGFDLKNSQQLTSPYLMISGQQYLMANSYLLLELWQPMSHEFSGRRAPIVQVGLALKLI